MSTIVPLTTEAGHREPPICPQCESKMILVRVMPEDHHEQWLYRCPACEHQTTIKVEALA